MTQTSNRFMDELGKLMTDAAGVAQGAQREVETAIRSQVERFLADMDLVRREDYEVLREVATQARQENEKARQENEKLNMRVEALEETVKTLVNDREKGKSK